MGDLIGADLFRHLVEAHGHTEAYEPRVPSLWRAHLFAHGLGPRNIPTVWDPQPVEPPSILVRQP